MRSLVTLERGLKGKSARFSQAWAIVLDYVAVGYVFLDLAVPEIFDFKNDVGASLIIMFIGNPGIENISNVMLVLCSILRQLLNWVKPQKQNRLYMLLINIGLCRRDYCIETLEFPIKIILREAPTSCLK